MRKQITLVIVAMALLANTLSAQVMPRKDGIDMKWFTDSKFGLFLHWGLYSVSAGDWKGQRGSAFIQLSSKIPMMEMYKIAATFNPTEFDADAWVLAAKDAGMKYLVITTKHSEGFAMFDSPTDNYNIRVATPFGRDPVKELSVACRKHGLKFGVYYSLGRDWSDPDCPTNWPRKGGRSNDWDFPNEDAKVFSKYYQRKAKPQIIELLKNYEPDIFWFDVHGFCSKEESREIMDLIEVYRPNCIVNDRIGHGYGDYVTPEQVVPGVINRQPWETCMTMSGAWEHNRYDTIFKSPEVLIRLVVDAVSKGGNMLLNVGPTAQGTFPQPAIERLAAIGGWMRVNGEAIYGTQPWRIYGENPVEEKIQAKIDKEFPDQAKDATSKSTEPDIRFTTKADTLYVIARSWSDPRVVVRNLSLERGESVKSVTLLGCTEPLKYTAKGQSLTLTRPTSYTSTLPLYTFKVELQKAR